MTALALGLLLFLGIHTLPHFAQLRTGLMGRLGAKGYRGLFALISFVGLGLIIWGKGQAPFVAVFDPPRWGRHVTMTVMLFSSISMAAIYLPTNIKRFTPHPMLWGTALWGLGHIFANGDLASLLLFGGFLLYCLFDIWSANGRGAAIKQQPVALVRDAVVVGVGAVNYAALLLLHPYAFGVSVVHF